MIITRYTCVSGFYLYQGKKNTHKKKIQGNPLRGRRDRRLYLFITGTSL